jgi:hypothetical protein
MPYILFLYAKNRLKMPKDDLLPVLLLIIQWEEEAEVQRSICSFLSPKTRKIYGQLTVQGQQSIAPSFKFKFVCVQTPVL